MDCHLEWSEGSAYCSELHIPPLGYARGRNEKITLGLTFCHWLMVKAVDRVTRPCSAVTLVTLPKVTYAATMRKISFWRYLAVNRKTILAALACALLLSSMLGCGTTNHLQSITLGASLINGTAPTSQPGFFSLQGNGGTIQLQATGNYSSGKTRDLTQEVTYTIIVDPNANVDAFDNPLPSPCYGVPCAQTADQGTVEISITGLVTAVGPATCTFVDTSSDPAKVAWAYVGDYEVTAKFGVITSQPVYIPVASGTGNVDYIFVDPPLTGNNPNGLCNQDAI